jgi:hypothetical protein
MAKAKSNDIGDLEKLALIAESVQTIFIGKATIVFELEKKEYKEDTVLTIFWWFFVFISFSLISTFWDFAFPFVLAFGFVNGHSWLATIILAGLILSMVVGIYALIDEFIIKNKDQR